MNRACNANTVQSFCVGLYAHHFLPHCTPNGTNLHGVVGVVGPSTHTLYSHFSIPVLGSVLCLIFSLPKPFFVSYMLG